jgi:hypothetical protein
MTRRKDFISLARLAHGNEYDYSKCIYKHTKCYVIIICPEHGEFEMRADCHLLGAGCKVTTTSRTNTHLQRREAIKFIIKAVEKFGDQFDYSKVIETYTHSRAFVIINCIDHGNFKQYPASHLDKTTAYACLDCFLESKWYTTEEFIEQSQLLHKDKYDYSRVDYKDVSTPVIIRCKTHGYFEQAPKYHFKGVGCQKCSAWSFSQIAINWLDNMALDNNIIIQHAGNIGEFSIPNSRYKVDGYCAATNTCLEYFGCWYHGCPTCFKPDAINSLLKKTYGELYEKTIKRTEFIESQGFNVVSIWGHDWFTPKPFLSLKGIVTSVVNSKKIQIKLISKKIQVKLIPQNIDPKPILQKIQLKLIPQKIKLILK